ncbi:MULTISPECIES: LysR family transcriptional regulator [unclassified Mesorhizobium]|uniref:LysR family transcriptional regulator n=1 Tax=unclassified Mesorhizobium TaxID=325217 RepID=UPI000F76213B|nr:MULTISPECIES: LysR family transcriptional regulator [unclassified Mesorhizobium]AZO21280.1 LysR family transcriptional regulator [Mesorhizobium sp. M1E.F.Ca.ET.045.02.1.1]RUW30518.1 LysR family transcriptional regulator [Mesorhizobium sp. M1E.F.Ca.ET.041.01.1.1]RUW81202.1 LysR family transcriptional regulator [Mesorhizobium sp. M1E.F.Ca.ET.063.01.1.1]RWB51313.1 MAG: LysR family transcriptional regulator [Mesorhizobium sp.]RWD81069.1 MAG: LysR family transcriptional regulator [Mesorhizobium 
MTTILEKTAGLVAFVRTVDAGSFHAASRLLGSSPSAVSKSVARLERRLGVRLIQRSTRHLGLTSEGIAYYERVAPLLRALDDAEDIVQMADTARGLLRVTAPIELGRGLIASWAELFLSQHGELKLELSVTDRHADLIREGYDMAVRLGDLSDTGLVARKIGNLPIVLVAAPVYIERRGHPASIDALQDHDFIRHQMAGRPYPVTFANGTQIVPNGRLDTDDGGAIRQAALAGAGIAHLMQFAVQNDLDAGRLVRILPGVAMPTMPVHIVHAFGRQLPVRARLFVDFLAGRMAALSR